MHDAPAVSRDVPVLVGYVKDEVTIFTAGEPWFREMTEAELQQRIAMLGPMGKPLVEAWRKIILTIRRPTCSLLR